MPSVFITLELITSVSKAISQFDHLRQKLPGPECPFRVHDCLQEENFLRKTRREHKASPPDRPAVVKPDQIL